MSLFLSSLTEYSIDRNTVRLQRLGVEHVRILLESVNLKRCTDILKGNHIDGVALSVCENTQELEEYGIKDGNTAKELLDFITEYRRKGVPTAYFMDYCEEDEREIDVDGEQIDEYISDDEKEIDDNSDEVVDVQDVGEIGYTSVTTNPHPLLKKTVSFLVDGKLLSYTAPISFLTFRFILLCRSSWAYDTN